jgi:hypothetical protein
MRIRRWLWFLPFILVFVKPAYSQNTPSQPLQFYCAKADPPVFKSWEKISLTYCLKYKIKARDGRTLKIITNLNEVNFESYEVDGRPEVKRFRDGDEVHLRISYRLRRADHNKTSSSGVDTIPSFIVQYVIEWPDGKISDPYAVNAKPVFVKYISTLTEQRPDLRDDIDFGKHLSSYAFLVGAVVMFLLTGFVFLREAFGQKHRMTEARAQKVETKETANEEKEPDFRLSTKEARKALLSYLRNQLKNLESLKKPFSKDEALVIEGELHRLIRNLFSAEFPELGVGKTPQYIEQYISRLEDRKNGALPALASFLCILQSDLEIGEPYLVFGLTAEKMTTVEDQKIILENIKQLCYSFRRFYWLGILIRIKRFFNIKIKRFCNKGKG